MHDALAFLNFIVTQVLMYACMVTKKNANLDK